MPTIKPNGAASLIFVLVICSLLSVMSDAKDESEIKWGHVNDEILQRDYCPLDTSAAAAVIFRIGEKYIDRRQFVIETKHHVRIQIFKEEGKKYATVKIPYWHDESVMGLKAQTILPNGKKYRLKRRNIAKEGDKNKWMYQSFTIPHVESNCVIEYKYTHTTDHMAFIDPWQFQEEIPTELSRVSVAVTKGFYYTSYLDSYNNIRMTPKKEEALDINTSEPMMIYTWEFRDLPAIKKEPYITTLSDYIITLKFQLKKYVDPYNNFTFVSTWEDVRDKALEYYRPFLRSSSFIDNLVDEIIGNEISSRIRTEKIYDYVRDNIILGDYEGLMGGITSPREVVKKKSASRIEKNLLLLNMLDAARIDAAPVLISTRGHGRLDTHNPRLNSFNHLIVQAKVANRDLFLDATVDYCPFDILPSKDNCGFGFIFNEDRADIVQIPAPKSVSMVFSNTDAKIDEEGNLTGHTQMRFEGYKNVYYRNKFDHADENEDVIKDLILDHIDNLELDSIIVYADSNTAVPLVVEIDYSIGNYASVAGDMMYFKPSLVQRFESNPFSLENRSFPVDYSYPQAYSEEICYHLPEDFTVEEFDPRSQNQISGQWYKRITTCDSSAIHHSRSFHIEKIRYYPNEYSNLRKMYSYMIDDDKSQVVVKKTD